MKPSNAVRWVRSPEGKQALAKVLATSKEVIKRLQEKRKIPYESLHNPVTR